MGPLTRSSADAGIVLQAIAGLDANDPTSLPCGLSEAGLPLSLQFVGHSLAEPRLVQAGAAYEGATEWHKLHPPGW